MLKSAAGSTIGRVPPLHNVRTVRGKFHGDGSAGRQVERINLTRFGETESFSGLHKFVV